MKKRNSSAGGAALHLGSGYQVRVAGWLAAEMLVSRQGRPFSPGGEIVLLRGETQESVDDLLVGASQNRYGFIQAKRRINFSEKLDSDFASVIDQVVRQIVEEPAGGVRRPWSRELAPATDRLLLITSSRSSEKIKVHLREVLVRARELAQGQPLSDAAANETETEVLRATVSIARSCWKAATGGDATDNEVHNVLSLLSVEVLDVEKGELGEREAVRTLSTMVIVDRQQEGAAWSSVLQACRTMVEQRSGLDADALRRHLEDDGIAIKSPELSRQELQRSQELSAQIDKLIDEARDAVRQYDHKRAELLLQRIELHHESQLSTFQRFRVISNYGFAELGLGKPALAAKRFLAALALQPEDEKARTNEVLAYYIIGDYSTAFAKAEKIRPQYPSSTHVASHWILASPREKTAKQLEQELSSIIQADGQVCLALAHKALNQQDLALAGNYAERATSTDPHRGQPRLVSAQICMATLMRLEAGHGSPSDSRAAIIEDAEKHVREAIRLAEIDKDIRTQQEARLLLVDILLLLEKKQEAYEESDRALRLNPDNMLALMGRSQTQFEMGLNAEGIASLERAYSIEARADVAFSYGKALFTRATGNDLKTSIKVLKSIDLSTVVPMFRHSFAIQTVRAMIKDEDWPGTTLYLDSNEALLAPETVSMLRGLEAHHQGLPEDAQRHAESAQSLLTASSDMDVKVHLAHLFMMVGRAADALPLYQEAFDANISTFDAGRLLDCAAQLRRDEVVIQTFRTLRSRGQDDWYTVSFGVQYVQKYNPSDAADILKDFIQQNPTHKLAKLYLSVLGLLHNRSVWVSGEIQDLLTVDELPAEHIMQVVHVLRHVGNPDGAADYAYRYLRLHLNAPEAHRAMIITMSPFDPMPSIKPSLDQVEVGAAVRYDELPAGDPDWVIIEDTKNPISEMKEKSSDSRLARELLGKRVGDIFVLAPGMIARMGIIRQIVPKYVWAFNYCGDKWQINFPDEAMIESVHLGNTEEQIREGMEQILQVLDKQAESEVEKRKIYNTVSTPLHVFGKWARTNAYEALISLATAEDQPVRCTFGTIEEKNDALTALKSAKSLVLDLSAIATIRLLELDRILTSTHFQFQMTEHSWRELRETLSDKKDDNQPSMAIGFQEGKRVTFGETVQFKKKRAATNQQFLELVEKHCKIVPVEDLASLSPAKRVPFEQVFGQYGVESMMQGAKSDCVLWSDDLVQSHIGATEFGTRRAWTQVILSFLADQQIVTAKERDAATAKLIGMDLRTTFFDAMSFVESVHLAEARPWVQPLQNFIRQFSSPDVDLKSVFPILVEFLARLYREPLLPEHRCNITTALLDATWQNPAARRSILSLRANTAWLFNLNPVGEAQFTGCFDQWQKRIENPIIPGA